MHVSLHLAGLSSTSGFIRSENIARTWGVVPRDMWSFLPAPWGLVRPGCIWFASFRGTPDKSARFLLESLVWFESFRDSTIKVVTARTSRWLDWCAKTLMTWSSARLSAIVVVLTRTIFKLISNSPLSEPQRKIFRQLLEHLKPITKLQSRVTYSNYKFAYSPKLAFSICSWKCAVCVCVWFHVVLIHIKSRFDA